MTRSEALRDICKTIIAYKNDVVIADVINKTNLFIDDLEVITQIDEIDQKQINPWTIWTPNKK